VSIYKVRVAEARSATVFVLADSREEAERIGEALADDFERSHIISVGSICDVIPDERWWGAGRWHYPERVE